MTISGPSHKRWRLALGVLVAVLVMMGWLVAWPAYQRDRAIEEIERVGGHINIEETGSQWLDQLGIYPYRVVDVDLADAKLADDGQDLSSLTHLKKLILNNTKIGDDGLKHLRGMTSLQILWLDGTQITDDGLQHLSRLTNLQILDLTDTEITNAGLKHLTGLKSLEKLYLSGTQTTDDGVKILQEALPNCRMGRYMTHGGVL